MWIVKVVEYYFNLDFKSFGIYPRDTSSLSGIFFSPFIHADFNHLLSNSMPLFLLCAAILFFYKRMAFQIIFISWILTGTSVWLGGRYSWHIGASGLVYAFASFLFFSGILSKNRQLIAISLLVIFLYGGLIWGVLPGNAGISWESHLYGFAVGFILAYFYGKEFQKTEAIESVSELEDFTEVDCTHNKELDVKYFYKEESD
jgi:membrane associated rhomboid family serine protease